MNKVVVEAINELQFFIKELAEAERAKAEAFKTYDAAEDRLLEVRKSLGKAQSKLLEAIEAEVEEQK